MSDLLNYSLSELLPFSRDTYFRLFELYNTAIWPAQAIFILSGLALIWLASKPDPPRGRVIAVLLSVAWFWVAIAFHYKHYAKINWAASVFGAFFILQGLLLLWRGALSQSLQRSFDRSLVSRAGAVLVAFSVLVQPLMGLLSGRLWTQLSVYGTAPDPTAAATLGLLLVTLDRQRLVLMVIPILWCLVSGATAWAMKLTDALTMPVIALAVLLAEIYRRFR